MVVNMKNKTKKNNLLQAYLDAEIIKKFRIYLIKKDLTYASWLRSQIDQALSLKGENKNENK